MFANQMEIPEPTPIGPEGIHEIVPRLSLRHVAHWSNLEPLRDLIPLHQDQDIWSSSIRGDNSVLSSNELLPSVDSLPAEQSLHNKEDGFTLDAGDDVTALSKASTKSLRNDGRSFLVLNHDKLKIISSTVPDTKGKSPTHQSFHQGQWHDRFHELVAFQKKTGHLAVPNSYPPNQMVRM
jgi:hypothetical protein